MRIIEGDTVIHRKTREIGIVIERRERNQVVVRWPERGGHRESIPRHELEGLAEAMAEARRDSKRFSNTLSLTGASTLSELVSRFGYSTGQLRRESLRKVANQLTRAGLLLDTEESSESRDSRFWLSLLDFPDPKAEIPGADPVDEGKADLALVELPSPFWPQALGLPAHREVALLRALTEREPLLCVLHLSESTAEGRWLQPTWEALLAWAFRSAQRFSWSSSDDSAPAVKMGSSGLLQGHLSPSALDEGGARLRTEPRSLNLVTVRRDAELPVDFVQLKASWPGALFEFFPAEESQEIAEAAGAIARLLFMVGGQPVTDGKRMPSNLSPLRLTVWAREASEQLLARGSTLVGDVFAEAGSRKLRGSNEQGTALALKARLAWWLREHDPRPKIEFESVDSRGDGASPERRIDLVVEGMGHFEVESLRGSGPMEVFFQQKIFARLRDKTPFSLVVPNDALVWAGPYLADISFHLGERGRVLIPGAEQVWMQLEGARLANRSMDIEPPEAVATDDLPTDRSRPLLAETLKLQDIAGYPELCTRIQRQVIWPERHARLLQGISRSPGILFFGPPGCGKSRLAKAIAGELEQDVRLLAPSDLRGEYLGWGQIRVREQFTWLAERERRMLVIDELDAVARSRRGHQMHSDDMATVNELLVQLDKVSRLGRIVVGTTNYVDSLDDAVLRTGRFGNFIPVGPPDLDAATAILVFYLEAFAQRAQGSEMLQVAIPSSEDISSRLKPIMETNSAGQRHFSGSDLEAAVAHTITNLVRESVGGRPTSELMSVDLVVSAAELVTVLDAGPRSIRPEAMELFAEEMARYCGR